MLSTIEWERFLEIRVGGIAYKAPRRVREQCKHKEERQVVCVPESFEALLANFCGGC